MTLPVVPGSSLSFAQVNTELGLSSTAQISLNDSAVRTLAGVGASPAQIAITNLSGKSNTFSFAIASNTANLDVRSAAVAAGWGGTAQVICTINSGVYVYSNSTGSYACTVSGSFPGGLSLVNNGVIVGRGGNGGQSGRAQSGGAGFIAPSGGASGGPALNVSVATSITNNGSINGGGGGGGGGCGGAGSGKGGQTIWSGGGGGGGIGGSSGGGTYGIYLNQIGCPGGNGGQAGSGGTLTAAGSPGINVGCYFGTSNGNGGAGGGYGSGGANGTTNGIYNDPVAGGGAAGAAVVGNSNITWVATGTRNGSIS